MSESKDQKLEGSGPEQSKHRRNMVKGIALGLGGVTVSRWSKPVVETVVLPVHAQVSPGGRILAAGSGNAAIPAGNPLN